MRVVHLSGRQPGRRTRPYFAFLALGASALFFGGFGGFMLLGIDSKQLSTRVALVSLALGLVPYILLFGRAGYALNAVFLVAALSSGLAMLLRRSSHR
jgi:O-antigen/teichoic acid export membrane protein